MESNNGRRGRPWSWLAAALLGLSLFAVVAQPAEAARFRGRGWGRGWGYRAYRMPYRTAAVVPATAKRRKPSNAAYLYA